VAFSALGTVLQRFNASNLPGLLAPWGAVLDPLGNLYVANSGSSRLTLFSNVVSPAAVNGDPAFVGLRGQSYQVHGMDGEVYNLISCPRLQVNAKFAFLTEGQCPIGSDGVPHTNCWSHPGSYLGAIGVQQRVGKGSESRLHRLEIVSGSRVTGFALVQVDGAVLTEGSSYKDESFSILFASSHTLEVTTEQFTFTFTNSDFFINQAVATRVPLSSLEGTHGLLGQTHSTRLYSSSLRYIEGEVDDYLITDKSIFGTETVYNRFNVEQA